MRWSQQADAVSPRMCLQLSVLLKGSDGTRAMPLSCLSVWRFLYICQLLCAQQLPRRLSNYTATMLTFSILLSKCNVVFVPRVRVACSALPAQWALVAFLPSRAPSGLLRPRHALHQAKPRQHSAQTTCQPVVSEQSQNVFVAAPASVSCEPRD